MRLRCGDRTFTTSVRTREEWCEVEVDGRKWRMRVEDLAPGVFAVIEGTARRVLHLVREGAVVHAFWGGVAYVLEEEREGARAAARHEPSELAAPMPGRVSAVKTAPGRTVSKGEELVVVEAMKMENALRAPRDGRVRAVFVEVGDMVVPGRALVELEP